eukprot:475751_1
MSMYYDSYNTKLLITQLLHSKTLCKAMTDSIQAPKARSEKDISTDQSEGSEGYDSENETLQLALKLSKTTIKTNKDDNEGYKKTMIISPNIITENEFCNIEASFSLDNLVNELDNTLSSGHYKEKHIFNKVQMLMENYDATTDDYEKYAMQLDENQYTRNLIKKSDYFTLMLLVWPPSIASPIHDHGGSECWLRVIKGELEERFYEKPEKQKSEIKLRFSKVHKAKAVCFIDDNQGLHAISNPLEDTWCMSLHCYVPGYEECHAFFDQKNSGNKKKCKLTFTSINGIKVVD